MHFAQNQVLKNFMFLLLIVIPLFSLGLSNHGLWSADEPRVAEIGREMALTGNWAVPTLNEKPFLEEPPLYYGALALIFKVFGVSDKVARIPSAFFSLATVLVLFFVANSIYGPRIALLSGIILATTGEYFRVAHWVVVDSALTFFVVSTMALSISGYLAENSRKKLVWYSLMYVAATLAFYSKGFIGIVIPGLGILAFLVAERNFKEILRMRLWLGALIFVVMTLPWFIALWQQAGTEYLNVFFMHNHLQRFLPAGMAGRISGSSSGHHHPLYYYLVEFPIGFLPWSLLLIPVFIHAFSKAGKPETQSAKGLLFAKCWFFAGLIFLSIASTKRMLYLMPIFAPMAMLTAMYISSTVTSQSLKRLGKVFLWIYTIVLLAVGVSATPVYVFVKGIYPWIVATNLFSLAFIFSLFMVTFSIGAAWFLWHGNPRRYWAANTTSIIAGMVFAAVVVAPLMDRHKSFVPFCQDVMATVPHDQTFFAYNPDETLRGAVPFYTEHYLAELNDLNSIHKIAEAEEPFFIMIRDKRHKDEDALLSTGRLSVFFQKKMGIDRTLTVFKKNNYKEPGKIRLTQKMPD